MKRRLTLVCLALVLIVSTGCTQGGANAGGGSLGGVGWLDLLQRGLQLASSLVSRASAGGAGTGTGAGFGSGSGTGSMLGGGSAGGLFGTGGTNTAGAGFSSQTRGGSIPSGWQGALGGAPRQAGGGGTALADPATSPAEATGSVFRVVATAFWNQPVAGKTVEDGDARLDDGERGVALPSRRGLGKWVAVRWNGRVAYAPVIDVGPVYTDDDYWNKDGIPRAQKNAGQRRTGPMNEVNGTMQRAGYTVSGQAIDLTPTTWKDLGATTRHMKETVEWWFVDEGTARTAWRQRGVGGRMYAAAGPAAGASRG